MDGTGGGRFRLDGPKDKLLTVQVSWSRNADRDDGAEMLILV